MNILLFLASDLVWARMEKKIQNSCKAIVGVFAQIYVKFWNAHTFCSSISQVRKDAKEFINISEMWLVNLSLAW